MTYLRWLLLPLALLAVNPVHADEKAVLTEFLSRKVLEPRQTQRELIEFLEPRIPRMPVVTSVAEWEAQAAKIRQGVLDRVVFRGEAAEWRKRKTQVKWLDTMEGGPGYKIKKLRFEAVPGLWIPALLYEPENLKGKVPVSLAVNGHDRTGKAVVYKQMRCINMAKRGMLVLNVEWFGMGQLNAPGYAHGRMNQLDLCGTSGLAPFYLSMSRSLDILLDLPNADPKRVVVSGLSGGGWQTIFISSLDTRVTLTNPVAGYTTFRTRIVQHKDLGDSEQTPCDLATVADYNHLTALMAPRPALLTYNAKDECCFEAGYALPPLLNAATPIFKLYGREKALRSHINHDPGTHNFEKDNRQALYRMLGDFFFAEDKNYSAEEIPAQKEVKTREELAVELPAKNADFNSVALALAEKLPHNSQFPTDRAGAEKWQRERREQLRGLVQFHTYPARAERLDSSEQDGIKATFWRLKLGENGTWTVPVVELTRGQAKGTTILLNDAGRRADPITAQRLLGQGQRVLAVDLISFGEAIVPERPYLFDLMVATIGERSLGLQASQLAAVARWSASTHQAAPVTLAAVGPRLATVALVTAALDDKAVRQVEALGMLGSLKEILEQSRPVEQMPEQFCFGLLESFDVKQLVALAAPRPVVVQEASPRAKKELAELKGWYQLLGRTFDPLASETHP
jgi:hypothetical protein